MHRDLKPENVLLADDGRIKIGDFGLARAATANTATGAALLGTIAYLSPELVTRGIADTRSDIYAVGIMMYEMLTGEQPYKGEQPMQIAYQHANDSVPTPSSEEPEGARRARRARALGDGARPRGAPARRPRACSTSCATPSRCSRPPCRPARSRPRRRACSRRSRRAAGVAGLRRRDRRARPSRLARRHRARSPTRPPRSRTRSQQRRRRGLAPVRRRPRCWPASPAGAGWWFGAGPGRARHDPARRSVRTPGRRDAPPSRTSASRSPPNAARSYSVDVPVGHGRADRPGRRSERPAGAPRSRSTSRLGPEADRPSRRSPGMPLAEATATLEPGSA